MSRDIETPEGRERVRASFKKSLEEKASREMHLLMWSYTPTTHTERSDPDWSYLLVWHIEMGEIMVDSGRFTEAAELQTLHDTLAKLREIQESRVITTTSGKFVIFDITSFLPGKPIPKDYFQIEDPCGPWYFRPADWNAPDWGGVWSACLRGFPMAYSPGYPTAEEALAEAQKWEDEEPERNRRDAQAQQFMTINL